MEPSLEYGPAAATLAAAFLRRRLRFAFSWFRLRCAFGVLWPCRARPFPAPVPPLLSFVFVLAATLVACLAALVLEVSFVSYVSESSWETDFCGDEFVTGGAAWCEKSFVSHVSESSRETAFSDDKFMTGVASWFETESGDNELVPSGCVL